MKITNYEKQVHNEERFNVYVDNKYSFSISMNGWIDNHLYIGKDITKEDIEELHNKDNKQVAYEKTLSILERGIKTQKEVERKLKTKKKNKDGEYECPFSDDDIEYAINKAKQYGYIDDNNYVKHYIMERAIPNKWGKMKIYTELLKKGINKELIESSLKEYLNEDDMYDAAYEVALKKYRSIDKTKYDKRKIQIKLNQFLLGKGYDYDIVKYAIEKIYDNEDDE